MVGLKDIQTPAYVFDKSRAIGNAQRISELCSGSGCRMLYPLKTCALRELLEWLAQWVDGFAVSSLFEARLAREIAKDRLKVHLTSPGIRQQDAPELARLCDRVACNSINQLRAFEPLSHLCQIGLRVNPQLSFVDDERYDPCRRHSKLGVSLSDLPALSDSGELDAVRGIHFHSNSESSSLEPLHKTILHMRETIGDLLDRAEWINMGGGYLFEDPNDPRLLERITTYLKNGQAPEFFMEPGCAIVNDACHLVASVLDVFGSDGKDVAILDTTVNHLPEVLEFDYCPDILNETADGPRCYTLAGSSCLSGDLFGEYEFSAPLRPGDRIEFAACGAYSMSKAHMFNGLNLPSIYVDEAGDGNLSLARQFSYTDYASRCGNANHACL